MNELKKIDGQEIQIARPQPTVGDMLQSVIASGVTSENVNAIEKLVGLYERMELKNAEKQFASAFAALQSDMPIIVATSVIPNRGKYERFEDIMRVVQPLLAKHGFSVSFGQEADDKRVGVTCLLRHSEGHSAATKFSVRLGGRADSDTQADCKASTTAKRNALLQALNIVIRQDCLTSEHDAMLEGGTVTQSQAADLERRVKETSSDAKAFLKFAGADKYSCLRTRLRRLAVAPRWSGHGLRVWKHRHEQVQGARGIDGRQLPSATAGRKVARRAAAVVRFIRHRTGQLHRRL